MTEVWPVYIKERMIREYVRFFKEDDFWGAWVALSFKCIT